MKYCRKCERLFEPRQRHHYLCRPCWWTQRANYPAIHSPAPLPVIPETRMKALLQLCHPDKHNNSQCSHEITQWLLRYRHQPGRMHLDG